MTKVFDVPESIKIPEITFSNIKQYQEECDEFLKKLKSYLLDRIDSDDYTGEIIRFPVADGYAEYMIVKMSPPQVIHLPLWDGWHFEYIRSFSKTDIKKKIQQQKAINQLFSKKNELKSV